MGCKIEQLSGIGVGILGLLIALQVATGQLGMAIPVVPPILVVAAVMMAGGAYGHGRLGSKNALIACWLAAPPLVVIGSLLSGTGALLAAVAVFVPTLASLLHRSRTACALPTRPGVPPVSLS